MNRRRVLNGVHRSIARKQGVNAVAWFNAQSFHQSAEDMPLERLSVAQLDQAGPKLVTSAPRVVCPDCYGAGEIIKADGNPNLPTPCEECGGKGYYEERS